MLYGVYSVRDEASGLFMGLTLSENNDVAIRGFDHALDNNEMMRWKPEDFTLYYLGDYDNETGVVTGKDSLILKRGVKRNGKK